MNYACLVICKAEVGILGVRALWSESLCLSGISLYKFN